jgi:hypothetical protein
MIEQIVYHSFKNPKYPITPEIHEQIVRVYQRDTGNGQVKALALRLGYPRWKITRYAIYAGLIAKQKKEPNWGPKEIKILKQYAHRTPEKIQKHLRRAGFQRSMVGIVLKRKRLRLPANLGGISATQLSYCLGVDIHNITRAIKMGKLKAEYRETHRTTAQGGDIWFIRADDIKKYILAWLHEIDIRKVDKYWFCHLLTQMEFKPKKITSLKKPGPEYRDLDCPNYNACLNHFAKMPKGKRNHPKFDRFDCTGCDPARVKFLSPDNEKGDR